MQKRVLNIDGVINFRDLGGYANQDGAVVAWGKCYRSAQLDRITDQGVQTMLSLDIRTVIDLRFSDETERYPTIRRAFPNAQIVSWQDESREHEDTQRSNVMQSSWRESLDSGDPQQVHEAMRSNYPKKLYSHQAVYRRMLLELIEGNAPLVFHCAAGKDRTGVAAALILSLLGVSDEIIVQDYLLSQQEIGGLIEYWMAGGASNKDDYSDFQNKLASRPKEMIKPIFDADEHYIRTLLDYVAEQYGGFENYTLQKLQLNAEQLKTLRAEMLT